MKSFLIILALLLAAILQTTIVPFLAITEVGPNLVLVLVLLLVIFKSFKERWPVIVLAGLFLDLFSGLPFGLISLTLVSTVYLIDWLNKNVFLLIKFWVIAGLIILATLVYNLLLLNLSRVFQIDLVLSGKHLVIEMLYNLFIISIFYGIKKIFHQE
jgi:rod shape-determining protein MreD